MLLDSKVYRRACSFPFDAVAIVHCEMAALGTAFHLVGDCAEHPTQHVDVQRLQFDFYSHFFSFHVFYFVGG